MAEPALKRALSLPLLIFYGLGTILGAGIYVLVGAVVDRAGSDAPLAFALAAALAAPTAFSYAELSSRMPASAGEAWYVRRAFGREWLAVVTGWAVVLIGTISAATMVSGFAGYLQVLVALPHTAATTLVVAMLAAIAAVGIRESVTVAAAITLVEIGGLLLVVGLGAAATGTTRVTPALPPATLEPILAAGFIAFYAFIGFEDMVTVAEEAHRPRRHLPIAIIATLAITTLLYLLVARAVVHAPHALAIAHSQAPLTELVRQYRPSLVPLITIISMVAVINGALIQIVKGARVMYGMSSRGMGPALLGRVHAGTRTPLYATALCAAAIAACAALLPLVTLARTTSFLTLVVFCLVNLALLAVKRASATEAAPYLVVPRAVPALGVLLSLAFLLREVVSFW